MKAQELLTFLREIEDREDKGREEQNSYVGS